jgi:hypothetical protein
MPDQPSPRRRFQFRLRTLMIVVTLFCVVGGYVAHEAKIVHDRRQWSVPVSDIKSGPATLIQRGDDSQRPGLLRMWLGDEAVGGISLPMGASDEAVRRALELFPEATIYR